MSENNEIKSALENTGFILDGEFQIIDGSKSGFYKYVIDDYSSNVLKMSLEKSCQSQFEKVESWVIPINLTVKDYDIFSNSDVFISINKFRIINKLIVYGTVVFEREKIVDEVWTNGNREVWVDVGFSSQQKDLITSAFYEYRRQAGHSGEQGDSIVSCAREKTDIPPLPLDNLTLSSDRSNSPNNFEEYFSNANVEFWNRILVGPGAQSRRFTGWRSLIINRMFEENSVYGRADEGILTHNSRQSPLPWNRSAEIKLNAYNLDRDTNINTWAGVIAHEFMHNLFITHRDEGTHEATDFIYAYGDCIAGSTISASLYCGC